MAKPAWLKKAESQIGYDEGEGNDTKYGKHYGLNFNPWCALFVSWSCLKSDHKLPSMQPGMPDGYAAVVYGIQWARAHGLWRPSWEAQPGDAICYGWQGAGSDPAHMHTGLVVMSGDKGAIGHTVEGNRGNKVDRHTFVVGDDVVLGTIALTKLLGPKVVIQPPKAEPQPRPVEHPDHTGPLADSTQSAVDALTGRLEDRIERGKAVQGDGSRQALRRLRRAVTKVLGL